MRIRRTVYWKDDQPITLAFVSGIDNHPEVFGAETPPPPPEPKAERAPAMTETFIRKVLGKPRGPAAQQVQAERIMRRIERHGF